MTNIYPARHPQNLDNREIMAVYYIDGSYVDSRKAVLPVTDLIILRGYGIFDYLRTYGGWPFHLREHVRRLQNSAGLIGLNCPWSSEEITEIVEETLSRNSFPESSLRLLVTGGDSSDSITPGEKPRLVVMVEPAREFPPDWYEKGVKVITTDVIRNIPGAKSIDYIQAIMSLRKARETGAVESLYVDLDGHVLEGTTSNVFAVIEGRLVTPGERILPGVTRDVVLRIAGPLEPEVRPIPREELYRADEVFLGVVFGLHEGANEHPKDEDKSKCKGHWSPRGEQYFGLF